MVQGTFNLWERTIDDIAYNFQTFGTDAVQGVAGRMPVLCVFDAATTIPVINQVNRRYTCPSEWNVVVFYGRRQGYEAAGVTESFGFPLDDVC